METSLTADQKFIRKLTDIILANLENEDFGVKELANDSGIASYSLRRRLHAINKKTVNQFIREVRLQRAMELIINEGLTASEVTYKVGFNSPVYFNKCFHEFFGYPPGKVKKGGAESEEEGFHTPDITNQQKDKARWKDIILSLPGILVLSLFVAAVIYFVYPLTIKPGTQNIPILKFGKTSIVVIPFQNLTQDTIWNIWQDGIQQSLITSLSNTRELNVRQKESVNAFFQDKSFTKNATLSLDFASIISQKLNADIFVYGTIVKAGPMVRIDAQLINRKSKAVIQSFRTEKPFREEYIFQMIDTLTVQIKDFLIISKLIKENPMYGLVPLATKSPEAFRYSIYGDRAKNNMDLSAAEGWYFKALAIDSNYFDPMFGLSNVYAMQGIHEKDLQWVLKVYQKRDRWPIFQQLWANWAYSYSFEPPEEGIKYLKQLQQIDDQLPGTAYILGISYIEIEQYDKAISELEKANEINHKWGVKVDWYFSGLGYCYHKTGQYKKEKRLYKKWDLDMPDNSYILFNQAVLALTEKDSISANQYIEKYKSAKIKESSSEADITEGFAMIYDEAGYKDKAEQFYRQALSLEPENPERLNALACFLRDNNRNPNEFLGLIEYGT